MPRVKLTKRVIDAAEYQGDGRKAHLLWDTSTPGLVLRVYPPKGDPPTATKSFLLVYRPAPGRRKVWHRIARYGEVTLEQAQKRAGDLLAALRLEGKEPSKRSAAETLEGLFVAYGAAVKPKPELGRKGLKSWPEIERVLRKDLVDGLGDRKAEEIGRAELREIVRRIEARGAPIAANRFLAYAKAFFGWAVEEELLEASPADHLRKPAREQPKTRVLSPEEIRALWWGLEGVTDLASRTSFAGPRAKTVRQALRLILATAQRPGEVCGMTPAERSGDDWTIPGERVKSPRGPALPHLVPLSPLAKAVLEQGVPGTTTLLLDRKTRLRLLPALGIAPFTPHDLRRTANTGMNRIGVDPHVVERVLNHSLPKLQRTYNLYAYAAEKREALERWGKELERIIE